MGPQACWEGCPGGWKRQREDRRGWWEHLGQRRRVCAAVRGSGLVTWAHSACLSQREKKKYTQGKAKHTRKRVCLRPRDAEQEGQLLGYKKGLRCSEVLIPTGKRVREWSAASRKGGTVFGRRPRVWPSRAEVSKWKPVGLKAIADEH